MEARDYVMVIRERGKLTQAQIAERTGIPQPTISKIERGDVADVMSRNYRALQTLHDEIIADAPPAWDGIDRRQSEPDPVCADCGQTLVDMEAETEAASIWRCLNSACSQARSAAASPVQTHPALSPTEPGRPSEPAL